jgi:uncharacterized protein involved in type VI secretion and phage assembly
MSAIGSNLLGAVTKQYQPLLSFEVEGVPATAGLRLRSFSGAEGLAQVGAFNLTVAVGVPGELGVTRLKTLLKGKRVTIGAAGHTFVGIIRGGGWMPSAGALRLRVTPAVGLLAHAARNRTWVNKTAPEILTAVLRAAGLEVDPTRLATARYPKLPFTAQYAEPTLTFFTRTAEEAGVTFIPTARGGREVVVLTDWSSPPAREVRLVPRQDGTSTRVAGDGWYDGFGESWGDGAEAVAGGMHDPDAGRVLPVVAPGSAPPSATAGMRLVRGGDGKRARHAAEARAASLRAGRDSAEFHTDACLTPGTRVKLDGDDRLWVVWTVQHQADSERGYAGRVVVVPAPVLFAPPRETPRPLVSGFLPARVVGPDGKAEPGATNAHIEPDNTVLVRFHFDDPAAEPVRIPVWSPGAGRVEHPRVGDEVPVLFQDGDIGQPLAVGGLPPVGPRLAHLPKSYPGATSVVFRPTSGTDPAEATAVRVRTQTGKQKVGASIAGNLDVLVRKALHLATAGALHQAVGGDTRVKVGGSILLRVAKDLIAAVGEALGFEVAKTAVFKARKLVLSADECIEIVCGGTFIRLTPAQLVLLAAMVDINPPSGSVPGQGEVGTVDDPTPPNPNL